MAQFEKLQELWQRQSGPPVSPVDTGLLTRSLRAYGRRQTYINTAKALMVASVLAWSIDRTGASWRAMAGFGLIGLAAMTILIRDWRSQRAIARLDFGAPSLGFVRDAISRIDEQRDPCRRLYWPFMASLVIGMNLMLAGTHRLWIRLIASGVPFLAFEAGMWVRRRRFESECRPLIERLAAMRSALEERVE